MTTAELTEVARFWTEFRPDSPEAQVIAGLQVALRAAEGQVAHLSAARTYDDGVRDAAKAIRDQATRIFGKPSTVANSYAEVVESLLSPAPAVAPVAVAKPGPTTPDVKFDAEAALVAQADQLRHAIGNGRQYVTCADLLLALDAGVIAGRGGGR